MSSLRDPLTGRYAHPPLSQIVGGEITDRTLSHSHHQVFSEWLSFTLAQQKADLDRLTGRYAHPPLSQIVGGEITDRTLSHSHHQVFSEWLSFTLAQQKAD